MHRVPALCALALTLWLAVLGPAGAEPVFPPGSRIGLEPPPQMAPSKRFSGFEDPAREAAVLVLDLPSAAYKEVEASLFAKPQKDVQGLVRRSFPFKEGTAHLAEGTADANGKSVHKWFFLATAAEGPVPDLTAFITVEVPEGARVIYTDAAIEAALRSVTYRQAPIDEQLAMMPFKLGDRAGFHVRRVTPPSTVVLTEDGAGGLFDKGYVIVSIAPGGPARSSDRARFAQDLINSAPVRDLSLQFGENMRIGGQPGNEVRASAKDADGKPIRIVQWLRFGSNGFMRIVAVSPQDEWDALFPRFRALRDGIDSK
jgi:hypothetical protein